MKKIIVAIVFTIAGVLANAAPHCCYFNNDGNKVTIIFTDEDAVGEYIVSDVMLYPMEVRVMKQTRQTPTSPTAWLR